MNFKQKILQKKIFIIGLAITLVILVMDQISKNAVIEALGKSYVKNNGNYDKFDVSRLISVVLVWNRGGSFGLFSNVKFISALLLILSLLTSAALIFHLWSSSSIYDGLYVPLIAGGALGNALDRILYGAVVDFIDIHIGPHHWPSFNLADSSILCGLVLYMVNEYLLDRKNHKNNKSSSTD
jgi:signal peptidase II